MEAIEADLDLVVADGEGGLPGLRDDAGGERHPHGADIRQGPLGDLDDLVQAPHLIGGRARDLVGVDDPGDATALVRPLGGGGGDVVASEELPGLDVVELDVLASHAEVEDVAVVVPVEAQDPGAAVARPDHVGHLLRRGGGEHLPHSAAVDHALADVAEEQRQVPRAPGRDDADLPLLLRVRRDEHPEVASQQLDAIAVGRLDALHGVAHERVRAVQYLLHSSCPHSLRRLVFSPQSRGRSARTRGRAQPRGRPICAGYSHLRSSA